MKKSIIIICIICLLFTGCSKNDVNKENEDNKFLNFNIKYEGIDVTPGVYFNHNDIKNNEEPKVSTIAGCALYGYDHVYTYDDVEITANILENNESELVYSVEFLNNKLSTSEGIKIGSTVSDVIKAYGEEYDEFNGIYTFNGVGVYLTIQTNENIVTGITYTLVTN